MKPATYFTIPCPMDFITYLECTGFILERQDQITGDLYYRKGAATVMISLALTLLKCGGQETAIHHLGKSYDQIISEISYDPFARTLFYEQPKTKTIDAVFNRPNIRA